MLDLNKHENVWRMAIDSADASVFIIDPFIDRIVDFNQTLLAATGLTGDALQQMAAHELFPDQLTLLSGLTLECLSTGAVWSDKFGLLNRAHGRRSVELFASTFEHGDRKALLFFCYEQRLLGQRRALTEIERLYRGGRETSLRVDQVFRGLAKGNQLILNAAGEGIYGVDAVGKTTFLNPAAERMLGWKADEVAGRDAHSLIHHSHQDGTRYAQNSCPIYAAFRDGRVHRVEDEVFWRRDGSSFPVEYTSTPIEEQGKLLGAVVVFRDVSEQHEARRKLTSALSEVEALKHRLQQENEYLQQELRTVSSHKEIVGDSIAIRNILHQIELVASSDATVLITGESGTGKELVARAIHDASNRSKRPLIRVNCASIPRDLFESEFFGHQKGAFTGAVSERIGRFELADGGTIFLDEVGELPLEHQAKLLRVLQEGQFERVGDTRTRKVDVRVIAATNRDLQREVADKHFREDLYFRLNVFPILSPPLRKRKDDIPVLSMLFLKRAMKRSNKSGLQISLADVERLQRYSWPGNIRELENVIERAVITAEDGRLRFHIPTTTVYSHDTEPAASEGAAGGFPVTSEEDVSPMTDTALREAKREAIVKALVKSGGRVSGAGGAAELLGVRPTTLYSRLKRLKIDAKAFKDRTTDD